MNASARGSRRMIAEAGCVHVCWVPPRDICGSDSSLSYRATDVHDASIDEHQQLLQQMKQKKLQMFSRRDSTNVVVVENLEAEVSDKVQEMVESYLSKSSLAPLVLVLLVFILESPPEEWETPGDGLEQAPPVVESTPSHFSGFNPEQLTDRLKVIYQDRTSNGFPSITLEFCT
eukprot:gene1081-1225_t